MIDTITVSSKGQIVLPKDIREQVGLKQADKLLVTVVDDQIVLKKLDREKLWREMEEILEESHRAFEEAGITREDVERAIKETREEMYPR